MEGSDGSVSTVAGKIMENDLNYHVFDSNSVYTDRRICCSRQYGDTLEQRRNPEQCRGEVDFVGNAAAGIFIHVHT